MVAPATRLAKRLRARDLDGLPHEWDTQYELVGGVLYMSRRPSNEHQETIVKILLAVAPAALKAGGHAYSEPGLVWDDEGDDNVSPDVAVVLSSPAPPRGEKLHRCPELVVEVLSPGSEAYERDFVAKRSLYWNQGAREYWIADPEHRRLHRFTRGPTTWDEQVLVEGDVLKTPLLPNWSGVRVSEILP